MRGPTGLRVLPLVLTLAVAALGACAAGPVYRGRTPARPLTVPAGGRAVVFTQVLRRVNATSSQGQKWYAELGEEDYRRLADRLTSIIQKHWRVTWSSSESVRASGVYRSGAFPTAAPFFLNPDLLPIVGDPAHVDLMLRSAAELQADLFLVVLFDFEISKLFGRPATVTTTVTVQVFSPYVGLVGLLVSEDSRPALPYDRIPALAEMPKAYQPVLAATVRASFAGALARLDQDAQKAVVDRIIAK